MQQWTNSIYLRPIEMDQCGLQKLRCFIGTVYQIVSVFFFNVEVNEANSRNVSPHCIHPNILMRAKQELEFSQY